MALPAESKISELSSDLSSDESTEELQLRSDCEKKPSKTPKSPSPGPSSSSASSSASSPSPNAFLRDLNKFKDFQDAEDRKIMYQNRNVLDLMGNLTLNWPFQYAPMENNNNTPTFGNNSQQPRAEGAPVGGRCMLECKEGDCGFVEPSYF